MEWGGAGISTNKGAFADRFGASHQEFCWRVLAVRVGCWPAFSRRTLFLLAEGRSTSSSSSPDLGAEQRRSPGVSLCGDGRAVSATPVTVLAEGRPCVATVQSGHRLQPPGLMPFWRPLRSEAMVECHGSLEAPSGPVPGGGEVVPEHLEGPDRVLQYVLEVLLENVQGPGYICVYGLSPVVIFCVLSLPY
jgi:hypothetical protein